MPVLIRLQEFLFKSGQTPVAVYKDMWQTIAGGGIWTGRLYNRRKDGGLYWEETVIAAIVDEHGRIAGRALSGGPYACRNISTPSRRVRSGFEKKIRLRL